MATTTKTLRVLVIEDCDDDYDLLLLKLKQDGFEPIGARVETMDEIRSALAKDHGWQIVFSDFDLPGFDGLRALELVREYCPEIPFFIISGVMDEAQAVAAIKGGAQDYFFKEKLARLGPAVTRELEEAEHLAQRHEDRAQLDMGRNLLRHDRIRFVDVMSHEMRTPLNIINVAAAMLDRYGERMDASDRCERTAEIRDAVARMTRMIDKVLLTSRLELRRWDLRAEIIDLSSWIEQFLAENTSDGDRKQRIRLQLSQLPAKVSMDTSVLEIALQNLLSNALKYSATDLPVEIGLRGTTSGEIEFSVRDYGIGIPANDLPHIWGSFYRAGNVGALPGTGLGLAIVKACADLHGGTLDLKSEPGQGTCIKMLLPDWLEETTAKGGVPACEAEARLV